MLQVININTILFQYIVSHESFVPLIIHLIIRTIEFPVGNSRHVNLLFVRFKIIYVERNKQKMQHYYLLN